MLGYNRQNSLLLMPKRAMNSGQLSAIHENAAIVGAWKDDHPTSTSEKPR